MNKTMLSLLLLAGIHASAQNTPLSNIQVIGSHNSYKKVMSPKIYEYLLQKDPRVKMIYYNHIPIAEQLDMGLRNLELDIWKDDKGGRFAHPKGEEITQEPYEWNEALQKPGFKVIHMPDYDYETQQPDFVKHLDALKNWSEKNPQHETIFITLELKDDTQEADSKFLFADIQKINKLLLEHLGAQHLITPKELTRTGNKIIWPTIDESRGKFVWIIDNTDYRRDLFDQLSLEDINVFINVDPDHPKAGCMIINNPADERIPAYTQNGIIIRTRADSDTKEARNNDYSTFEQAKKSGAQIITTDYYLPSTLFPSTYRVSFDNGGYVRVKDVPQP